MICLFCIVLTLSLGYPRGNSKSSPANYVLWSSSCVREDNGGHADEAGRGDRIQEEGNQVGEQDGHQGKLQKTKFVSVIGLSKSDHSFHVEFYFTGVRACL